ncbi:MAG: hypothetical protein FWH40_09570, partial [Coriobacteriia bacterium]|nr:hypothetical protein [Coriobacteriia bacterium]
MTVRDFREDKKDQLLGLIRANNDSRDKNIFTKAWDWISDIFINSNITSYGDDINRYHNKIIDKKNMTESQLYAIWENVYAVENDCSDKTTELDSDAKQLVEIFRAHAEVINPVPSAGGIMPFGFSEKEYRAFANAVLDLGSSWKADNITRDIERADDLRMQQEVQDYLASFGFTRTTWLAMSEDEKLAVLESMIPELNRIMGTNLDTKIDTTFEEPEEGHSPVLAWYVPSTNQMRVNLYALNDDYWSYMIFSSSAHEIRHTYQWETVQGLGCHIVSDETREAW